MQFAFGNRQTKKALYILLLRIPIVIDLSLRCVDIQLLGCTVLAVGIWISIDPSGVVQLQQASASSNDAYRRFLGESTAYSYQSTGAYLLIGVGTFIAIVGFLGCCGAIRESQFMLASVGVAIRFSSNVRSN
jgi:Tetraspanin family